MLSTTTLHWATGSTPLGATDRDGQGLGPDQRPERGDQRPHEAQPEARLAIDDAYTRLADQRRAAAAGRLYPMGEEHPRRTRLVPMPERGRIGQRRIVAPQRPDAPDDRRQRLPLARFEQGERLARE